MLRFGIVSSGSSGNAILVSAGDTRILIDNGLSLKRLRARIEEMGESLDRLAAIFVTHEHADHVSGLGVLARATDAPVYIAPQTFDALPRTVGAIPKVRFFDAGDTVSVDGVSLSSFSVSHDAADPVSFVVRAGGAQLGIASDLGYVSHLVRNRLAGSHGLILESNYCPDMLRRGPYPPSLQQRIHGKRGHLSNADMNALLAELLHDRLWIVVLAHLSAENNMPDHARRLAAQVLRGHPAALHVAHRDKPTGMFEIAEP